MPPPPLLPPRGLFIPTRVLFNTEMPASLKETLLMLMALTWRSDRHVTPLLSLPLLEQLTGKSERSLFGHLQALRTNKSVLRLQYAEAGQFIIELADGLFHHPDSENGKTHDCNFLQLPVKEEELITISESKDSPPPPDSDHDHTPEIPQKIAAPAPKNKSQSTQPVLPKAITAELIKAGVFPSLLDEIATRAAEGKYSARDLSALLAWALNDRPDGPAALFVTRLRAGARAPKVFFEPACQRCGKRGGHAQDCPQRYVYNG